MAEVVSTGVSHMCDNSTVSVKDPYKILHVLWMTKLLHGLYIQPRGKLMV